MAAEPKLPAAQASGAVVSVEEELAREATTRAALERPVGGAISLRAGIISWQGTPVAGNRLPSIVVDSVFENRWYDKPFNADVPANPACFAIAREEGELFAHPDSEKPQGAPKPVKPDDAPEGSCRGCPKNAWGSDPRGGRGKACAQTRRLALIPADAIKGGAKGIQDAEVAILKPPVTSVRYWSAFVNRLAAVEKRPTFAVITECYTEPHAKHQFHLYFNLLGLVPNDLLGALREKIKAVESMLFAPYAISENAPVAPEIAAKAAAPKKF